MIDRFDHLHLCPSDFDRSLAFYCDTLGWSVVDISGERASGRRAVVSGGAMKVVLTESRAGFGNSTDSRPVIHLDIHDSDKRFSAMPAGDHVVVPPGTSEGSARRFVVRDPDGNLIAFEEVNRRRG